MKINLVFKDWTTHKGKPLPHIEALGPLMGDFHGGATFPGTIQLDAWQEKELREALEKGFQPVFLVNP